MLFGNHPSFHALQDWFGQRNWTPLPFQIEAWQAIREGKSGLLIAAPGTGKTYAVMGGFCLRFLEQQDPIDGLQLLWITPLRALAADITSSLTTLVEGLNLNWQVGCRTGDTLAKEKTSQLKRLPEILITTPESLHLLFARPEGQTLFKNLQGIVIDEWHELMGNKRGVQVELALAHLQAIRPPLQIWGISATIGNPEQALEILCGSFISSSTTCLIRSLTVKPLKIATWIPTHIERFPWIGHSGLQALPFLLPLLEQSASTLIFTNTRAQAEKWYQALVEAKPEWEAQMGIHHGSLEGTVRRSIETGLQNSDLKVVVCTSSLDLGVDFEPVEQVFQIGSPKGIARCLQRAGRSGHRPGQTSSLLLVPTHALELIEAQALKQAIAEGACEARMPLLLSFDVLMQYLLTLSVGEGFVADQIYQEVKQTYAFRTLQPEQWHKLLQFLEKGGEALQVYEEYHKLRQEAGIYRISSPQQARKHRLSIGTMMGQATLRVRYLKGAILGTVEESFATRLKPGDLFWYNGKCVSFVYLREMTVWVKRAAASTPGIVPRWRGGRLPYSPILANYLMQAVEQLENVEQPQTAEAQALQPLLKIQKRWSLIPKRTQLLIEQLDSKEGHHLFFYPFEGRLVHEAMAQLFAYRLSQRQPLTLSMAYNDYGFELLANQPIIFDPNKDHALFSTVHLRDDLLSCLKKTELAKHHFREIARVSGLIFTGYPGKSVAQRHLQMSAELLFSVFEKYDPTNLLIQQCYQEVLEQQWDLEHLQRALERVVAKEWILKLVRYPTPFAFPLFVEQWRDRLSTEQLSERIAQMTVKLEKLAGS